MPFNFLLFLVIGTLLNSRVMGSLDPYFCSDSLSLKLFRGGSETDLVVPVTLLRRGLSSLVHFDGVEDLNVILSDG